MYSHLALCPRQARSARSDKRYVLSFAAWILVLIAPAVFAQHTAKPFAGATQSVNPALSGAPDFSLSAPAALSVTAGMPASVTVSVEFVGALFGSISLGATNLPPGISASFAPASMFGTGTVNVTFFAQSGTAGEMGNVTLFGVNGTIVHAVSIALTVGSGDCGCDVGCVFINSTPAIAVTIPRGGAGTAINLSCLEPDGPGALSVTGIPPGVSAFFNTNMTAGSEALTLSAADTAPLGTFTLTVLASSGTGTAAHSLLILLTIVDGSPVHEATCHVAYDIVSEWDGMFEAVLSIDNTGTTPIPPGWTLTWSFANGQTVFQLWNATVVQSSANVTVQADANIPAGGSDKGVGFLGTRLPNVPNLVPTTIALNGIPCFVN
jgi:hypothetical protein